MGLDDQGELNKTVSAVAMPLWAVCLVWERASKWTGHRSAHRTESSCGEPVATPFINSLLAAENRFERKIRIEMI